MTSELQIESHPDFLRCSMLDTSDMIFISTSRSWLPQDFNVAHVFSLVVGVTWLKTWKRAVVSIIRFPSACCPYKKATWNASLPTGPGSSRWRTQKRTNLSSNEPECVLSRLATGHDLSCQQSFAVSEWETWESSTPTRILACPWIYSAAPA